MPNPASLSGPAQLSTADFFGGHPEDPLRLPEGFADWLDASAKALGTYEPTLCAAPRANTRLKPKAAEQTNGDGQGHLVLNLASYDYLGLGSHPRVVTAAEQALRVFGVGAAGSPMLSGRTEPLAELEQELCRLTGRDSVLVFPSGFQGAMATVAAVLRRGDVAVLDERCHISLFEGGSTVRCASRDLCARRPHSARRSPEPVCLAAAPGRRRGPLFDGRRRCELAVSRRSLRGARRGRAGRRGPFVHDSRCQRRRCAGTARRGRKSRTAVRHPVQGPRLPGRFCCRPRQLIDYIKLFANGYGFSCALPPAILAAAREAVRLGREAELRERLASNARYFRDGLTHLGLDTGRSSTHVIPIMLGRDRVRLYELTRLLRTRGLFVAPVDYPSVPDDAVRLRATVTAAHTRDQLDRALEIIEEAAPPTDRPDRRASRLEAVG